VRLRGAATCPVEPESRAFADAALAVLRADRWSPGGWARFVDRVARRSAQQAAAHPRAVAELTALHAGFALASRGRGPWWIVISWLMAVTHLGLLGDRRSIGWPNVISLVRANLPVTGEPLGRWVGVAAAVSDQLDGTLARRTGPTMFGFYADSLADAAFWTWLGFRHEPSRWLRLATLAAWAAPVVAVTATSLGKGKMIDSPRPMRLRPAAAMQIVLAVHTLTRPTVRSRHSLGTQERREKPTG
jgi:phosphatidylglycerophosphate synthase